MSESTPYPASMSLTAISSSADGVMIFGPPVPHENKHGKLFGKNSASSEPAKAYHAVGDERDIVPRPNAFEVLEGYTPLPPRCSLSL
jgi:hypothetical protein